MANKFDRTNYPTQEPYELVVGDRWVWKREDLVTDYPTDTYALSYEFHCDSGGGGSHAFTINAIESGGIYYVEVASATTATYNPHKYVWDAYITRTSDSQRIRVDSGATELLDNLADTNADQRSHAKKCLDAIEAVIQNRATIDQQSMSIAGRSLSRMSIDDLLSFRNYYKAEYLKEVKKLRVKNESASGNIIRVKF